MSSEKALSYRAVPRAPLPDWRLPLGVPRSLWDAAHDDAIARRYDDGLAGHPLCAIDVAFVRRHCPRRGRLLDLGCGTGRLLVPLAADGYRVVGVDLSAEMLRVAAEKGRRAGVSLDLLRANLAQLECLRDGVFDYAACLFSTLGMVAGREARRRVVAHVFRSLRPGGVFVCHFHNRWHNVRDGAGRAWLVRDAWRSLTGHEAGDRTSPQLTGAPLTLHHFTRREAQRLLTSAGFRVCEKLPVSADGELRRPWLLGDVRAYGFLIAAQR